MTAQEKLYTASDLWELSQDEHKHLELIRGVLVEMSPANELHGELTMEIGRIVANWVRANDLGRAYTAETGFELFSDPDTVLAPDVAFVSKARLKPRTEKFSTVAPDLAVEVVSPGNSKSELHEKVKLYFEAGTRQVWVFYPKSRTVYVYHSPKDVTILDIEDTLEGSDLLPGFSVRLCDLFAVLDG